ncbi:polysaccharide pyruvyl transferase family protein [Ruminococcus difficilis]|uniref:Polysaccharide pyruvyl transferase family protein n=1 Tax=Ruminococcus difficilis TaxID=2763069 RepID=A0A934TZI1_9FIRM|nr:polysaccharide pyruvyl transferase family protein [Ruminococcus difficilis]
MRNIIITGGELFNKGAQAMVFITVDELKKRYPDHKIYLLSELDLRRPKEERDIYTFDFTGWYPVKYARAQSNYFLRQMCKLRNTREYNEAYELYSNCDLMVDISGFALGSNWSYETCTLYLDHLEFAKEFDIPVYIMPQSFGPFNFKGENAKELDERIRRLMPTAKIVCAREQEGLDLLANHYHLNNVIQKVDLVLNNKSIDLCHIYKNESERNQFSILEKSIGIIPNSMIETVCEKSKIFKLYETIIQFLINEGYFVYIVGHAESDLELCNDIKNIFDNDRVVLIDKDLSCLEFNDLVSKFKFVIASRFHSIVHAYKNCVPCIALGWAQKYQSLLSLFHQEKYAFDFSKGFSTEIIIKRLQLLENDLVNEVITISESLKEIQLDNVFDVLPEKL